MLMPAHLLVLLLSGCLNLVALYFEALSWKDAASGAKGVGSAGLPYPSVGGLNPAAMLHLTGK
jgi:hypothetical protein